MHIGRSSSRFSRNVTQIASASLALFVVVISLAGCSERRVTDFTIISTKNTLLLMNAERQGKRITGEDCHFLLFGMPDMKEAIDDAIEKAGPEYDALVDGVVTWQDDFFQTCYKVEGTPIKAKNPEEIWAPKAANCPRCAEPKAKKHRSKAPTTTSSNDSDY